MSAPRPSSEPAPRPTCSRRCACRRSTFGYVTLTSKLPVSVWVFVLLLIALGYDSLTRRFCLSLGRPRTRKRPKTAIIMPRSNSSTRRSSRSPTFGGTRTIFRSTRSRCASPSTCSRKGTSPSGRTAATSWEAPGPFACPRVLAVSSGSGFNSWPLVNHSRVLSKKVSQAQFPSKYRSGRIAYSYLFCTQVIKYAASASRCASTPTSSPFGTEMPRNKSRSTGCWRSKHQHQLRRKTPEL
jgi:hypothetical protein